MVGSCSGCAQSHATLQEGVKKLCLGVGFRILKHLFGVRFELKLNSRETFLSSFSLEKTDHIDFETF